MSKWFPPKLVVEVANETLIEEVKKRPELYDKRARGYIDRTGMKPDKWLEIAESICDFKQWTKWTYTEKMKATVILQGRWNNIRSKYAKLLKQQVAEIDDDDEAARYPYFEQLSFLRQCYFPVVTVVCNGETNAKSEDDEDDKSQPAKNKVEEIPTVKVKQEVDDDVIIVPSPVKKIKLEEIPPVYIKQEEDDDVIIVSPPVHKIRVEEMSTVNIKQEVDDDVIEVSPPPVKKIKVEEIPPEDVKPDVNDMIEVVEHELNIPEKQTMNTNIAIKDKNVAKDSVKNSSVDSQGKDSQVPQLNAFVKMEVEEILTHNIKQEVEDIPESQLTDINQSIDNAGVNNLNQDLNFALYLVPMLRRLPEEKKLQIRKQILKLFEQVTE